MAAGALHISISAETIAHIGGLAISNSMLTSVVASAILILFAFFVHINYKDTDRPTGIQNVAEWLVEMFYSLIYSITDSKKKTAQFLPIIATFFLFIVMNNWLGLLPGVGTIGFIEEKSEAVEQHTSLVPQAFAVTEVPADDTHAVEGENVILETTNTDEVHAEESEASHSEGVFVPYFRAGTADLNMTLALAIISQFFVQALGVQYLGLSYFGKFFNFSSPIMFFVGILEFMGEFTKIISYAFRLFGNIFAGEVLLAVISFLVPVIVPMPFYGMELFVGMIQGLVFAMLSVVFFNMATVSHKEH